jgi:hypothetical protein
MGYRSQVAGCISVDSYTKENEQDRAKFKEMVGFIKLSRFWELWNTKENEDHFGWQECCFVLYGADWKWYSEYEDVKAWNELWESMQEIKGISGYFCRVGEELDDIEEKEFGEYPCHDFFYPFSALSFDGDHFLGRRDTDVEENQADQAPTNPQEESCGSSVAQSA